MKRLFTAIDHFFFQNISASGFGLMRIGWALVAGIYLLFQWSDVLDYYSAGGILPPELKHLVTRNTARFTLLTWITDPEAVFALYLLTLFSFACTLLGIFPRASTILSAILLTSFHEGNPLPLGGGDTVLRHIGFFLVIAPNISAFSLKRLKAQWQHWKGERTLLPPLTMPIWPMRLLLWQVIVLYVSTFWYKNLGTMWWAGTAVAATFHHPIFFRWPMWVSDLLAPLTGFLDIAALLFMGAWGFLLIPKNLTFRFLPELSSTSLKRILLTIGCFFHGSILLLMDAGSFPLAMFAAYLGLLTEEDFAAIRKWINQKWQKYYSLRTTHYKLTVLYDGHCGLCLRGIFLLSLFDHLKRLKFVNFHDAKARKDVAPNLKFADLDKAMHIQVPSPRGGGACPEPDEGLGRGVKTFKGFDAFRVLSWHLPPLWPLAPLLSLPGIPIIGRLAYARIAARRKKCTHKACSF